MDEQRMRYEIIERYQSGWHGPDRYVAVVGIPEGEELPRILRRDLLRKRGISFFYCGQGYTKNSGPRSMLGRALQRAAEYITKVTAAREQLYGSAWNELTLSCWEKKGCEQCYVRFR